MTRTERAALYKHASLLHRIGFDLAQGKLESDQVAKWLRIMALRVRVRHEDWIKSATYHWLAEEVESLDRYENPEEWE